MSKWRVSAALLAAALPTGGAVAVAAASARPSALPFVSVVSPSPAAPGLPLYVTGRSLGHVASVAFRVVSVRGKRPGSVVSTPRDIRREKNTTQFEVTVPAIAPGRYELAVRTSAGESNRVALRVVADRFFVAGRHCPPEWELLTISGRQARRLECRSRLRWLPYPAPAGVTSGSAPASGQVPSSSLAQPAAAPDPGGGGSPVPTVARGSSSSSSTSTEPATTSSSSSVATTVVPTTTRPSTLPTLPLTTTTTGAATTTTGATTTS